MTLTYDLRHNIAYLRFAERTGGVETIQISNELNVDIAPSGKVYGLELLNANEHLLHENGGRFLIVNEATGRTQEVSLAS